VKKHLFTSFKQTSLQMIKGINLLIAKHWFTSDKPQKFTREKFILDKDTHFQVKKH